MMSDMTDGGGAAPEPVVHPAIARLIDEQAVQAVLFRYASALDARDWARLRTCFTPDAVVTYEAIGQLRGYEEVEALVRRVLGPLAATQHIVSNVEVVVDGDRATSRCNLQSMHVRETPSGDNFIVAGVYTDELRRTPDGWRIARRQLQRVWTQGRLHDAAAFLQGGD
jgi:3-phenylpropionate/cinnamic acid dioxygenase small subunit